MSTRILKVTSTSGDSFEMEYMQLDLEWLDALNKDLVTKGFEIKRGSDSISAIFDDKNGIKVTVDTVNNEPKPLRKLIKKYDAYMMYTPGLFMDPSWYENK